MINTPEAVVLARMVALEEALAEYAHLYGLTSRARVLFSEQERRVMTSRPESTPLNSEPSPLPTPDPTAPPTKSASELDGSALS